MHEDWATTVVDNYTDHQVYVQRVLSLTASCMSIVFGLAAFYLYISMKVKVFRHHLILLLLLFDFGKAVVLLWYPARVLLVASAYDNRNFCDVVGFFTSSFIEGADFAVFFLAIHTALLVFFKHNGPEGGLYRFRYFVYAFTIILPLVMASLVFIDHGRNAYKPYITWCYLPVRPIWYRLLLSWVPRYIIIVSIITIYVSIYVYVKLKYREVVRNFSASQKYVHMRKQPKFAKNFRGYMSKFTYTCLSIVANFPGIAFLQPYLDHKFGHLDDQQQQREAELSAAQANDPQISMMIEIQKENLAKFEVRRNNIERQIRSIFVYPIAYVFLWLAPFGLQCIQYNYVFNHGTVFWVSAAAAFMQPFNCVIDSIAFFIREKPYREHEEKIFTKENQERVKRALTFERAESGDSANSSSAADSQSSSTLSSSSPNTRPKTKTKTKTKSKSKTRGASSSGLNHENSTRRLREASTTGAHMNETMSEKDGTIFSDAASPSSANYNSANLSGAASTDPYLDMAWNDPFAATTARRVDYDEESAFGPRDNLEGSEDEGEIDLLEFLR